MSGNGFIVIDRAINDWKWRDNSVALGLWLHILLSANWKDGWFSGHHIPRGSFATSMRRMSEETALSEKTIRKWLKRFEEDKQIELRGMNRFTIIKVINYAKYQDYTSENETERSELRYEPRFEQRSELRSEQRLDNRTNKQINKETKEQYISGETPEDYSETDSVIDYLNLVTGQKYKYSKTSRKHIHARLSEGFTVEDCKSVIDKKTREWIGTDMMKYLNPETLFSGEFEKYLNQIETPRKRDLDDILMEEHFKNEQRRDSEDSEDDQFGFSKINWD